jgi:hypothetical protein
MVAYARRHEEQKTPHGSVRRPIALRRLASSSRAHRTVTIHASRLTGHSKRRLLLCLGERLPLAAAAEALPALEERLRTVQERMAHRRVVGERLNAEQRGYDAAKKVRGRKRHILVDPEELILKAKVHSAKAHYDEDGIRLLLLLGSARRSGLSRLSPQSMGGRRLAAPGQEMGRGGYGPKRRGDAQTGQAGPRKGGKNCGRKRGPRRVRGWCTGGGRCRREAFPGLDK